MVYLVRREHYQARCSDCGDNAEVCPKRAESDEAVRYACRVLQRSGWHADGPVTVERGKRGARWLCPKCAKAHGR